MASLDRSLLSSSSNDEQPSGGLPLPRSIRYNPFVFDPPAVPVSRQRMSASNESSTITAQLAPEPVCRCNNCTFTDDMRDCERSCCMDVKEMRELCRKNGIPEECITSHPGFLTIAFNGEVLRMN